VIVIGLLVSIQVGSAQSAPQSAPDAAQATFQPKFSNAVAFDVSPSMRDIARRAPVRTGGDLNRPELGPTPAGLGFSGDAAVQATTGSGILSIPAPSVNFEGIPATANIPILGGIPIPPDPVGDVGPNHYVQMVNTAWAVFSKTGTQLLGPLSLASIWAGFAVTDCNDNSGDPIVVHDQLADRWILTQFSTNGPEFFNCVAVSTSADPTGSYFRFAFSTGLNFPDYPKYGVWPNAYFVTTREFAPDDSFAGIGVYALERDRMLVGDPGARAASILVPPGSTPWLTGDGWLPSDLDGNTLPPAGSPNYIVGTQDDEGPYGAPIDAINVFKFSVTFGTTPSGSLVGPAQVPVAEFDSDFPCKPPGSRDCIEQPDTGRRIDILSYRQRPVWRLAYRNFGTHESLVTNQSVEGRPELAGTRWYEIRSPNFEPVIRQQATFAPNDGVHRWMGSIAQDKQGNMLLGYSVSNKRDVFPGIRYTGRLAGDPLNTLPQGEGIIINGGGSQTDKFSRWGDYTSMNLDPTDDCTFWYVNQYYAVTSGRGWQTRIAAVRFPGCA
jgi:hypothetical protein